MLGLTYLLSNAFSGPVAPITEALLKHGAIVDAVDSTGANLLHQAALNNDMMPNDLRALLALPKVHGVIDGIRNMPRTWLWKLIFKVARLAYRRGTSSGFLIAVAQWQGATPLHLAVLTCHADTMAVLVESGADVGVRNGQGHTPLELAGLVWGGGLAPGLKFKERKRIAKEGEVPAVVREALTPNYSDVSDDVVQRVYSLATRRVGRGLLSLGQLL